MRTLFMETGLESAAVEAGGADALALRLWAALEGGALALLAAALLAHARRARAPDPPPAAPAVPAAPAQAAPCETVLITNSECQLGQELKRRLEAQGYTVCSVTGAATRGAASDAASRAGAATVDALVVVGADRNTSDIEAISRLVSEDVYHNLKLMESLASRVRRGGVIAWACTRAEAEAGAFSGAEEAFDAALRASLQLTAGNAGCEAVWCGQEAGDAAGVELAARRVAAALARTGTAQAHATPTGFSIRNTAYKISGCVGRWLKIP